MSRKKQAKYNAELREIIKVEGNTLRKVNAAPNYDEDYDRSPKRQPAKRHSKKLGFAQVALAAVFFAFFVLVCVGYLNVNAENSRVRSNITSLQTKLETITAQNDSLDYSINSYVDINHIIDVATNDLGMVKISKDNINTYKSAEYEYMQQYSSIPTK